jgi:hypothetical protein
MSDEMINDNKSAYQPPVVEQVMTAEELAREIHYAGTITEVAQ